MRPTAYLVNTARGGLVVEADLAAALKVGPDSRRGMDVFEQEPTDRENPLCELGNVILSPHVAGLDELSVKEMGIGRPTVSSTCPRAGGPRELWSTMASEENGDGDILHHSTPGLLLHST